MMLGRESEVRLEEKKQVIDRIGTRLQAELVRIIEILQNKNLVTLEVDYPCKYLVCENRTELKNRMHEARRDMIRLEKLLYDGKDYEYMGEKNENSN